MSLRQYSNCCDINHNHHSDDYLIVVVDCINNQYLCGHCCSHALQLLHSSTNKASSNAVSERATVRITFVFAAIIYWFIPRLIKARPILFTMLEYNFYTISRSH
ncbi:hypothetical protein PPBDW_I21579 [Photobacterium kishitanii]|nr:hypothetical protein PPBDW_I21579 [Photobacterium kishitanii]